MRIYPGRNDPLNGMQVFPEINGELTIWVDSLESREKEE